MRAALVALVLAALLVAGRACADEAPCTAMVNDWRTLPAPQRDAFDALGGWIDAHEGDVRFVAGRIPTPARAVLRPFGVRTRYACMVFVALLLVSATRLRASPPIAREDRIAC